MNQFIKDYFSFNKSERNGLVILISIILLLILFYKFSYLFINDKAVSFSKFNNEIDKFEKSLVLKDSSKTYKYSKDTINQLRTALGSNYEMIFNLEFMRDAGIITAEVFQKLFDEYTISGKQLVRLIESLK